MKYKILIILLFIFSININELSAKIVIKSDVFKNKAKLIKEVRKGKKLSKNFKLMYEYLDKLDVVYTVYANDFGEDNYLDNIININVYSESHLGDSINSEIWVTMAHELAHAFIEYNNIIPPTPKIEYTSQNEIVYDAKYMMRNLVLRHNNYILYTRIPHEQLATMFENIVRQEVDMKTRCLYGHIYLMEMKTIPHVYNPFSGEDLYTYTTGFNKTPIPIYVEDNVKYYELFLPIILDI
jgi:hypothetical protein